VLAVSADGAQDILMGASLDGDAVLVMRGGCASSGPVWLYDGSFATKTYTGVDVSSQLTGLNIFEARFALVPDGLSVVGVLSGAVRGFGSRTRASRGTTSFGPLVTSDFAAVNAFVSTFVEIRGPYLSFDGLSLFFRGRTTDDASNGSEDKNYEARRATNSVPFEAPAVVAGDIGLYDIVSLSSDRLTAFSVRNWGTDVFIRPSLDATFVKQSTAALTAFRSFPIGENCTQIMANSTIAGCPLEEVYWFDAL
jgi:hypothetical protein